MADTSNAEDNGDAAGESSQQILPQQQRAAAPSEKEVAEYDNERARKNRERFIYRPFRQFIWRPTRLLIAQLDSHDGAVTAAATLAIAILTGFLAWYANGQEKILTQQIADSRVEQRAFVYFDEAVLVSYPPEKPVTYAVLDKIINSGNTPAKSIKLRYSCPSRDKSKSNIDPYDLEPFKPQLDPPSFLGPKQYMVLIVCELPLTLISEIKSGIEYFAVVEAHYIDEFEPKKVHITQTTWLIRADAFGRTRLGITGPHNCSDDDCPH